MLNIKLASDKVRSLETTGLAWGSYGCCPGTKLRGREFPCPLLWRST